MFIFWQYAKYLPITKMLEYRGVGSSSTSPCSVSSVGHCHQFVESSLQSCSQSGWFGDSHGIPLPNNSTRCNTVSVLEASFNDKQCPIGALSPLIIWQFYLDCFYMSICLRKFLLGNGFGGLKEGVKVCSQSTYFSGRNDPFIPRECLLELRPGIK